MRASFSAIVRGLPNSPVLRTPMLDSPAARFAVDAVREAATLTRRVQAEMVTDALTKGDKSPVTVGDFAAQAVVGKRLWEAEGVACRVLVGEESADSLRTPDGAATLEQVTHFVQTLYPDATPDRVCEWIDVGGADAEGAY